MLKKLYLNELVPIIKWITNMSLISKGMPNKLREVVFIQILKNLKMLGSWNINKITTSDLFKEIPVQID